MKVQGRETMNTGIRRLLTLAAMACALAAPVSLAQAQDLPSTIRVVVPYPAGGPTDFFARIVANALR